MTFVNMERIEKHFNNNVVLKDVSLQMNKGEIVSIIGPSGSGKSTFLRCLGQLETIDGGTITVDGVTLASTDASGVVTYADKHTMHDLLLRMGMVFQSFNLFPHMTVLENIMVAPRMVKGMKDTDIMPIAERLLNKVGLWDKRDMYPSRLSGGQQQRVAIARALITKPAIVLADEPTGNLDSKTSAEVLGLIKRTSAEFRQTVVMITHNNDIARLADRIVRIEDGKIVE